MCCKEFVNSAKSKLYRFIFHNYNGKETKQVIQLVECPRDAMQGIKEFIPTDDKISYLNLLLRVGFDVLDCGSFVSHKAVPQMADTAEVLSRLNMDNTLTKLSVIVANVRGAQEALVHENVSFLGFPLSISETFQQRNTNASIEEAMERVELMKKMCDHGEKQLLIYLSMGFGNPYGDPWNAEVVEKWVKRLVEMDIKRISLADTVGMADAEGISYIFKSLTRDFPEVNFSAHFHTTSEKWREKVDAAYKNGCKTFEGAIRGFGGCPMAADELTGNMPTENIVKYLLESGEPLRINTEYFKKALYMTNELMGMVNKNV